MHNRAPSAALLRYGALGIPLAFAGLPVYVHVPQFYADTMQMSLTLLGTILLVLRLADALIDPVIGYACDRFHTRRRSIMAIAAVMLVIGYICLFTPPLWAERYPLVWLVICLSVVYFSFSTLMINYYAMALDVAHSYADNTRAAAFREGAMLVGVLLASLLPGMLMESHSMRNAYSLFSIALLPLLCAGMVITVFDGPASLRPAGKGVSFRQLLGNQHVRWVLFIGLCNSIPTAITSTLFLFFTSDVLQADDMSGILLASYFLSAAAGMPLWSYFSARHGKKWSLRLAMCVAIACFIWAWGLSAGDTMAFAVICILSGMTMGADVTLLPSIMADTLQDRREATATAFGLWNLCVKLTMALAAGIALPMLALGGYHPGADNSPDALSQLSLCYALLPCLFKLAALFFLHISPIDQRRNI